MSEIQFSTADAAPTLRRGDHDPWVRYLEQLLTASRVPGLTLLSIGENFSAETEQAVMQFQQFHALEVNGVVDRRVWELLEAHAADREQLDETGAQSIGVRDDELRGHEYGVGGEVGQHGWRQVDLHIQVLDYHHAPFAYGNLAYVRFIHHEGHASDTEAAIIGGEIRLDGIWAPTEGSFQLFVDSHQRTPDGGRIGHISGSFDNLKCDQKHLNFHATQTPLGDTRQFSFQEAVAYGFISTTGSQVSWDLGISAAPGGIGDKAGIGGNLSSSSSASDTHTYTEGDVLTITFGSNGFDIVRL